eukprot:TRINITY_DN6931_c0_g1_i6.p1 TRINITY_DN6931_c0_g1~~TRINITY_DN6931_c0_g1_i6.p1  ORF type:complete len:521 (-),score=84.57 TRINITY_DN6931_c0_g1_i6:425-1936(-)
MDDSPPALASLPKRSASMTFEGASTKLLTELMGIPTHCGGCACMDETDACGSVGLAVMDMGIVNNETNYEGEIPVRHKREKGQISYNVDVRRPLTGPPLRVGEVWHLPPDDVHNFQRATLELYPSGICIRRHDDRPPISVAWSPFSLVQACRLHTDKADSARPWMRLFKVSIFHHGVTHLFATEGDHADTERTRWVADVSCALRVLIKSLFPPFRIVVQPVQGAMWTATRLLAGYMLMCDGAAATLVYCELHSHWDSVAAFTAYEDDDCDARVVNISVGLNTSISERVGVDCSCFTVDAHHFVTRTCAERTLWLRAISNVKVKIRHSTTNPTSMELVNFRQAIHESVKQLTKEDDSFTQKALLPRRTRQRQAGADAGSTERRAPAVHANEPLPPPANFAGSMAPLPAMQKAATAMPSMFASSYVPEPPTAPAATHLAAPESVASASSVAAAAAAAAAVATAAAAAAAASVRATAPDTEPAKSTRRVDLAKRKERSVEGCHPSL